jgi:hypothetical protein
MDESNNYILFRLWALISKKIGKLNRIAKIGYGDP